MKFDESFRADMAKVIGVDNVLAYAVIVVTNAGAEVTFGGEGMLLQQSAGLLTARVISETAPASIARLATANTGCECDECRATEGRDGKQA